VRKNKSGWHWIFTVNTNFDLSVLWERLEKVRSLTFVAESFGTGSGWNGRGAGPVSVEAVDSVTLLFYETGQWSPPEGSTLNFTNVFRWSALLDQSLIRLEHLRYGRMNPVYLFDLQQTSESRWDSVEPHVCSDDFYTAMLECQQDQLHLDWTVKGATKNERIRYIYA
tara:strand:- start:24133 stop:24636 length:504 start_codon:yes stop_codon:yes gene_type:complete